MRIQIVKGEILVGNHVAAPGDVCEVADDTGRRLVLRGHAVPYAEAVETAEAAPPPGVETAEAGPRARRKG